MRDISRLAALGLSLTVVCALTVASRAGGSATGTTGTRHPGTSATSGTSGTFATTTSTTTSNSTTNNTASTGGNSATTSSNAAATGSTANGAAHSSGGGLLCAGLLESGLLGDVFTVAPVTPARRQDPGSAIQFAPIWSNSHQATVGDSSPAEPSKSKPAVAIIKLPISFSEADRQKFAAAGWKPHKRGTVGISYCLDRAAQSDGAASPMTQGMICVTAAP